MSKVKAFTDVQMTEKSFNAAVKDVFAGVQARQVQIHQLLTIAFSKAQTKRDDGTTVDDFRWISTILGTAIETKGLNSQRMAEWIKSCVTSPDSPAPLSWDQKTKQLKKSKSGIRLVYNVTGTWFDFGKEDNVTKAFDFAAGLQAFLNKAAKAYSEGTMTPESKAAYEQYLGIQRAEATAGLTKLTPEQAAAEGVC